MKLFYFCIFLHFYQLVASTNCIENCEICDLEQESSCLKCQRGYVLDQYFENCNKIDSTFMKCIQISIFGECMRCDCGYSLQEEDKACILTSNNLLGCEVVKNLEICLRPKQNFALFKDDKGGMQIQFGGGSNCEIFNLIDGNCEQCHSGYFLDNENLCKKYEFKIANSFFTYFNLNGVIKSRTFILQEANDGVYPFMKDCLIQSGSGNFRNSICSKCQEGKIPNQSKTKCFKQLFNGCMEVFDNDVTSCAYCSSQNFYLKNVSQSQQACVPKQQIDLTEKCINFSEGTPLCEHCAHGLIPILGGCYLNDNLGEGYISIVRMKQQIVELFTKQSCEYWEDELRCLSCKKGTTLITSGKCIQEIDINCLLMDESGSCKKCISLKYYNHIRKKCVDIDNQQYCQWSNGEQNNCQFCLEKMQYEQFNGQCEKLSILDQCNLPHQMINICCQCINLYYIDKSKICSPITQFQQCFVSDGINNVCLICKKFYSKDRENNCIPDPPTNAHCPDIFYYYQEREKCEDYSFEGINECQLKDSKANQCLQCNFIGYFIKQGSCQELSTCQLTNGVDPYCYQSINSNYIDKNFEVQRANCQTNGRDNICQDSFSTHLEYCIIEKLKNNNQYSCELCYQLNYIDKNGICQPLDDTNCEINNGITSKCILCRSSHFLNQNDGLCTLKQEYQQNCKIIENNKCKQCDNLYYLNVSLKCLPLMDPQCQESDGKTIFCQVCKNEKEYFQLIDNFCFGNFCKQFDQDGNCIECHNGFIFISSSSSQKIGCLRPTILFCKKLNESGRRCMKCEQGYQLFNINTSQELCFKINLKNCIEMKSNLTFCKKCEKGFQLFSNGQCYFMKGCLEYNLKCLKCEESFYLNDGRCVAIFHCKMQRNETCIQCDDGYYISLLNQYDIFRKQTHLEENLDYLNQEKLFLEECIKIRNCELSDGINPECQKCQDGFILDKGICFIQSLSISLQESCLNKNISNECLKCDNLFYLNNNSCQKIDISSCSLSDGIVNACLRCSFHGFILSSEGICYVVPDCIISNGIDRCVICEGDQIANFQGYCQQNNDKIENCETYSFERALLPLSVIQRGINYLSKQENYLNILKTLEKKDHEIICSKCQNYYYFSFTDYYQCIRIDDNLEQYCFQTNGVDFECQICKSNQLIKEGSNNHCFFKQKIQNLNQHRCQIFLENNFCIKCYDSFYLDSSRKCQQRDPLKKCIKFNPIKDECIECRSGYKLKSIENHQIKICIQLDISEQVKHCEQYEPNTNICTKCTKYLMEDVIEFFLDIKSNTCKSVLHLMCQRINLDLSSCLVEYVPNCFEYKLIQNSSTCLICKSQYYLKGGDCLKHTQIKNCVRYSENQDICEKCLPLYFLNSNQSSCLPITSPFNCLKNHKEKDFCILCQKNYALVNKRGQCIKSNIQGCSLLEVTLQDEQICLKCQNNFSISERGKKCIFRLRDANCIKFNAQDDCNECKVGYFLNYQGNCIQMISQICQIFNCQIYDRKSIEEDFKCELCLANYTLDINLTCQPLDPDSFINIKDVKEENLQSSFNIFNIALIIIVLISLAILMVLIKKLYLKKSSQNQIYQKEGVINTEIQMESIDFEQKSNKIQI